MRKKALREENARLLQKVSSLMRERDATELEAAANDKLFHWAMTYINRLHVGFERGTVLVVTTEELVNMLSVHSPSENGYCRCGVQLNTLSARAMQWHQASVIMNLVKRFEPEREGDA